MPSVNPKAKSARSTGLHYTERRELRSDCTAHCKIDNMCKNTCIGSICKTSFFSPNVYLHFFLMPNWSHRGPPNCRDCQGNLSSKGFPPLHLPGISSSRLCWIGQKNVAGDNLPFPAKKDVIFGTNSYQVVSRIAKRPLWQYPWGMRQNAHLLTFSLLEKNPI